MNLKKLFFYVSKNKKTSNESLQSLTLKHHEYFTVEKHYTLQTIYLAIMNEKFNNFI